MAEVTDHAGDTMAELPLTQKGLERGKKIPALITAGWAEGKKASFKKLQVCLHKNRPNKL